MGYLPENTEQTILRLAQEIQGAMTTIKVVIRNGMASPIQPYVDMVKHDLRRMERVWGRRLEGIAVLPQASPTSSLAVPSPSGEVVGHPTTASPTSLERI